MKTKANYKQAIVYAIATLIALVCAYCGFLPDWAQKLSAVVAGVSLTETFNWIVNPTRYLVNK